MVEPIQSPDDELRGRLESAGLGSSASALLALRRPSVRLISQPADEADLAVGSSRLGGRADLPADTVWPRFRDQPLAFLAQIDLAQMHPYDAEAVLPPTGLLSFFYEAEDQEPWGFDPADRGSSAVLFTPADAPLERREHPVEVVYARFPTAGLSARAEIGWAPAESFDLEQVLLTRAERRAYATATGQDEDQDETRHRLLGHPDPIQGDMQAECQLVTHGIYCGDPDGYTGPQAEALIGGSADWRLLLQIDSDDAVDMMWGDVGRLYYWIQQDRLAERAWEQSWLVLQCC